MFTTDSNEKSSELREEKVQFEHDEGSSVELGANFDVDTEFKKYQEMGAEQKQQGSFLTNLKRMEFPLDFENKMIMVWLLGGFAAAGGILSGVDQSIISSAALGLTDDLHPSTSENSLISALVPLGAVAGSLSITPISKFGRKTLLMISCLIYTVAGLVCGLAPNIGALYAGRFLLGLAIGQEGGGVGVYIAESVPSRFRGSVVGAYQFFIAFGEVLGFAIGAMFIDVHDGWRYMLGSSLVFSTILLIGLFFLPESPRFLAVNGKFGEAYNVFCRLRDVSLREYKIEFIQLVQAAEREREVRLTHSKSKAWIELFTVPRNRRALVYGVIMISLGQLTGINAVMYYLSNLMGQIGFSPKNSVFMSLVGGAALMFGTIPGVLYMDRFGRRVWGYNLVGFFIGLVLVGVGYLIPLDTHLAAAEGVYLTGLILYMGFFGSYACLTWVVPSESFSIGTRSQGMTICSALLYLWAFVVTYNFNRMKVAMTYTGLTIGFYGGIAFLGFFYQLFFMYETRNKTLEEIDELFEKPTMEHAKDNIRGVLRFWHLKK
ncbi:HXT4 [Candida jiufengensis]|uniref:HXT4 n=1 Tax=Candida jiufengensis TaxID=497108 RepID=UPI0022253931|nr:HXT4 [Candida jiufengensis]KAI5951098.1 HXT4 [Candida jiufengensis]